MASLKSRPAPLRPRRPILFVGIALIALGVLGLGAAIVLTSGRGMFPTTATLSQMPTATRPQATPTLAVTTYVVQKGDSLYSIAQAHNLSVDDLFAVNSFDPCWAGLSVGDVLVIATAITPVPSSTPLRDALFHFVKPGDTVEKIAELYQTTVEDILELNADVITDPAHLPACVMLKVRWGLARWTPTPVP